MPIENILLITEDESISCFLSVKWNISTYTCPLKAIEALKENDYDLILCDYLLTQLSGLDLLQIAKEIRPLTPFILTTDSSHTEKGLAAIRLGAFHYLTKPLSQESVEIMLEKLLEHTSLIQENELLKQEISYPSKDPTPFIAESASMKMILKDIKKIAKSNASVFISGESGTGKEVIANAIHSLSYRSQKPFIRVNCAAIPSNLLESEFFGHEKGSFTGALQKRLGRFELADKGTLLLDEISEIPLELQPKLLRVIQEQEFERLGGDKPLKVDVRLISTSNRNMKEAIEERIFREDLYFRLHVIPLQIPALRDRKEDIVPLAQYFLEKLCKENYKSPKRLSLGAQNRLLNYDWPGNVRELSNIIERTIIMHSGNLIETDDLMIEISCPIPNSTPTAKGIKTLAELEKIHILLTLKALNNNKTQTAKSLGISIRTLRNKLNSF
jgi:two-component system, NtrC family, response regulator AtoC